MRCPDCLKFVSLELQEPEVENLEVVHSPPESADDVHVFTITGTVRIVRTCAECNQELKEATLEIEQTVELGENVHINVEEFAARGDLDDVEVEESGTDIVEEGGGRYQKSYFGASAIFDVILAGNVIASVTWSDKVAASQMDELV